MCFITGNRYWQFFSLVILGQNMSAGYLQLNNYCLSVLSVCFTKMTDLGTQLNKVLFSKASIAAQVLVCFPFVTPSVEV